MSAHTPGPWIWADKYWVHATMGSQYTICDGEMYDIPVQERIANARLMAAAPELLEALQEMLANCHDEESSDEIAQAVTKARAAIIKALGAEA